MPGRKCPTARMAAKSSSVNSGGLRNYYRMNADGPDITLLNGITDPRGFPWGIYSPDGTHIVFCAFVNERADLYVVKMNGTGLQNLTHSLSTDNCDPAWR